MPDKFFDKMNQMSYFKNQQKAQKRNAFIFSALAGFVGAIAALLLSPKSGKENREYVKKQSKKAGAKAKEMEEKLKDKFEDMEDYMEGKFDKLKKKMKKTEAEIEEKEAKAKKIANEEEK